MTEQAEPKQARPGKGGLFWLGGEVLTLAKAIAGLGKIYI